MRLTGRDLGFWGFRVLGFGVCGFKCFWGLGGSFHKQGAQIYSISYFMIPTMGTTRKGTPNFQKPPFVQNVGALDAWHSLGQLRIFVVSGAEMIRRGFRV